MKCILARYCASYESERCNTHCGAWLHVKQRLASAHIPSDYENVTLANSPVREAQPSVYTAVDAYAATFSRLFTDEQIKSLYLFSTAPGTGKTTTAVALANEFMAVAYIGATQRNQTPHTQPVLFLDVNELQTLYNEFNRSGVPSDVAERASRRYYKLRDTAKSAPFAVIDDIGVRSATEAFRGDLHSIINARCSNRLPTVYTSNVAISELATVFDARLADRVREQCKELAFSGASKRGLRR